MDEIRSHLQSQLTESQTALANKATFVNHVLDAVNMDECGKCEWFRLPTYLGSFSAPNKYHDAGTVECHISFPENTSWRAQQREIVKIRRAFAVKSWTREVVEYNAHIRYSGVSKHGFNVVLECECGGLNPECEIVEEKYYVKGYMASRFKSVCPE